MGRWFSVEEIVVEMSSPTRGTSLSDVAYVLRCSPAVARRKIESAIERGTIVNTSKGARMSLHPAPKKES